MKSIVVKFTVLLALNSALSFLFWSCEVVQTQYPKARLKLKGFQHADMSDYVKKEFYKLGPAGWMLEYYEYPTFVSTYVFCPDGDCNLTEETWEYNGVWRMDADTIRIVLYQKIVSVGIGEPSQWPQKQRNDEPPVYDEYKDITKTILFKRNLSWRAVVNSVLSENERPYVLISRDATCN